MTRAVCCVPRGSIYRDKVHKGARVSQWYFTSKFTVLNRIIDISITNIRILQKILQKILCRMSNSFCLICIFYSGPKKSTKLPSPHYCTVLHVLYFAVFTGYIRYLYMFTHIVYNVFCLRLCACVCLIHHYNLQTAYSPE